MSKSRIKPDIRYVQTIVETSKDGTTVTGELGGHISII